MFSDPKQTIESETPLITMMPTNEITTSRGMQKKFISDIRKQPKIE